MITYQLFKYSGASDNEEIVYENENENLVSQKAIELSGSEDNWYVEKYNIGFWTYRLEKCINGKRNGGWRFFNNGKEFTQHIRDAFTK